MEEPAELDQSKKKAKYQWTNSYEKIWESIEPDENGCLTNYVENIILHSSIDMNNQLEEIANQSSSVTSLKDSMQIKHCLILIDASVCMKVVDLHPNRFVCCLKVVKHLCKKYFDRNPMSQLSVGLMYSDRTVELVAFTSHLIEVDRKIDSLLSQVIDLNVYGDTVSIQNALDYSHQLFSQLPKYTIKHIILITASMTSTDPGNIMLSLDRITNKTNTSQSDEKSEENSSNTSSTVKDRISSGSGGGVDGGDSATNPCSIITISLTAEINLLKTLAIETNGSWYVIMDEHHFLQVVNKIVAEFDRGKENNSTSNVTTSTAANHGFLIKMGFPANDVEKFGSILLDDVSDNINSVTMCICHKEIKQKNSINYSPTSAESGGYLCPVCFAKYCTIPIECVLCGTLISSAPYLMKRRSLIRPPTKLLKTSASTEGKTNLQCFLCFQLLNTDENSGYKSNNAGKNINTYNSIYQCKNCKNVICMECEIDIHDSLFSCPGCV